MILSVLALSAALIAPQQATTTTQDAKPVTLNRVFPKGEKLEYTITSNLHVESRQYGLQTFIPDDVDLNYKFWTEVKDLKNDGVAVLHYTRPTVEQVDGATFERPEKHTIDKVDFNFDLTISPINAVLEMKDLNPPKKKPPVKAGGGDGGLVPLLARRPSAAQGALGGLMGEFIGELYRLALNVGSMDSALDFSPKLPLDEVKVGDTWKATVSYQPQKLKGKNGKLAVQRLDYTFTYKGVVTVNGKQYYRVNAALDLNSDLGEFINQLYDAKPEETHIKAIPLKLKQSIDYNLDMTTKRTISAEAKAEGGFKFTVLDSEGSPIDLEEEKLTGTTEMHLTSVGTAAPVKPTGHKNGH